MYIQYTSGFSKKDTYKIIIVSTKNWKNWHNILYVSWLIMETITSHLTKIQLLNPVLSPTSHNVFSDAFGSLLFP